ncbi:MAG: hypothetical protein KGS45_01160 [Planctomycetes bacterium]|nr:hypothetical protein [Planctomycetota bacterium]
MNTDPLQQLPSSELALLNLLILNSFNLRACISPDPQTHAARRTYITLLLWLDTPLIRPAYQALVALEAEKSAAADIAREECARSALEHAVLVARQNLDDATRLPDNHEQIDRRARELRLLARPLIRARRTSASAPTSHAHHTNPSPDPSHAQSVKLPRARRDSAPASKVTSQNPPPHHPATSTAHSATSILAVAQSSAHTPLTPHSTIYNLLSDTQAARQPLSPHTLSAATRLLNAAGQSLGQSRFQAKPSGPH